MTVSHISTNPDIIDENAALECLSALGQPTRLKTFRLQAAQEPKGIAAGEIARLLDVPQDTMSAHLAMLARSGLVHSTRQSRSIVYRADMACFRSLLVFLLEDCCGGWPEVCAYAHVDRRRKIVGSMPKGACGD